MSTPKKTHEVSDGETSRKSCNIRIWSHTYDQFRRATIIRFDDIKKQHEIIFRNNRNRFVDLNKELWEYDNELYPEDVDPKITIGGFELSCEDWVGKKISIYSENDKEYRKAEILSYDPEFKNHLVKNENSFCYPVKLNKIKCKLVYPEETGVAVDE